MPYTKWKNSKVRLTFWDVPELAKSYETHMGEPPKRLSDIAQFLKTLVLADLENIDNSGDGIDPEDITDSCEYAAPLEEEA